MLNTMARSFPLLSGMLFLLLTVVFHFILHHVQAQGALSDSDRITHCGRVIDNEIEARECLNVTNINTEVPLPVILNQSLISTTADNNFICANKPPFYTFSCTLYGDDLIWHFNNENVGGFLPGDPVGRSILRSFPTSAPVYNVTAVLTKIVPVSEYNVPFCVSILIVQPYSEIMIMSQIHVTPFTISCQGHCADENHTEVCQTKSYKVAETPTAPEEFIGTIQNVSDDKILGAKAIASLNWSLPDNNNETVINYYEVTLVGTRTNNTMSMRVTDHAQSLQALSYKYNVMLSEGNYTAASITAVDLCGQRSEPTQLELTNATTSDICASNVNTSDAQQSGSTVAIGACVGVTLAAIALTVVLIIILLILCYHRHQSKQVEGTKYSDLATS